MASRQGPPLTYNRTIESRSVDTPPVACLDSLVPTPPVTRQCSVPLGDTPHKERRREQNRIAQRKYRRKIADQIRQTEQFAQQVHQALRRNPSALSRCSECSHCHSLESLYNGFTELPRSESDVHNTTQAVGVLPPVPQEDLYDNDLSLDNIDFESTFLEHNTLDMTRPESNKAARAATLPIRPPRQPDRAQTNNDAPATPLWQLQDVSSSLLQEIVETDTNNPESANARTQIPEGLSQMEAAVHMAAREGHSAIVAILLRSGSYVDSRDNEGRTPLHHCAENGHVETMKMLLDSGADPNATDCEGTSVLLAAVKAGKDRVVEILVKVLRDQ
ncbi:hypothetical protein UA08_03509 [Talaromyces atroroseus]|uniref:BZIP domain-containing protein n=1 Tax=Talaromyces atroroseus TaxID=1441469 RepID=A0A225B3V5_TALAT|nr:hypothetical protein UA08_03509 [Talaromyces atroroseus]OKL61525.1 hypothetical protein UA08_03509 [Talaromyces atroroseus]